MALIYGFVKCKIASDPALKSSRRKNEVQYHLHTAFEGIAPRQSPCLLKIRRVNRDCGRMTALGNYAEWVTPFPETGRDGGLVIGNRDSSRACH